MYRNGLVIGIVLLLTGICIPPFSTQDVGGAGLLISTGDWLYVGGSGPGNYTRIQDAINASSHGDTVFVYAGTYLGQVTINKSINIVGEDRNTTFLIGYFADTLALISDWVNMSGFTIQYAGNRGEGVKIDSNHNHFFNNIIEMPRERVRLFGDSNTFSKNIIRGAYLHCIGNDNVISDNAIINSPEGLYLTKTRGNIISNNSFLHCGVFISDNLVWDNSMINNTVNGKPLVYLEDASGLVLDGDAGQIVLVNCSGITIENQEIHNTTVGIQISGSHHCSISKNTLTGNYYGISLSGWNTSIDDNTISNNCGGIVVSGDHNTISTNVIANNTENGVYLSYSDFNIIGKNNFANNTYSIMLDYGSDFTTILNNSLTHNSYAIRLSGVLNNTISANSIVDNAHGIQFITTSQTIVVNNTFANNSYGMRIEESSDNIIYHNNFIHNGQNAFGSSNNTWNHPVLHEGNYWSDYNGRDDNGDGIGDAPYDIPGGNNQDCYPFMQPNGWLHNPIVKKVFIHGTITNISEQGEVIWFQAVKTKVRTFHPWGITTYSTGETLRITTSKLGFIGVHYIFAFCELLR